MDKYMQNRELSWLRFNERVLMEATDESVPLLERLKFAAIFTSNLDEFFMIRVGSLHDLSLIKKGAVDNKTGLSAEEQLQKIYQAVGPLTVEKDEIYARLNSQLCSYGITALKLEELEKSEQKYIKQLYQNEIDPILSPQIVDSHHPFPHLVNKVLHIGARLKGKGPEVFGVIPVPASLPEVVYLPGADVRYVFTEDIILSQVEKIFKSYDVEEKTVFCITRNADITPNDENFEVDEDFRNKMKKLLRQRTKLAAVRLELSCGVSGQFLQYFCEKLLLSREQVYVTHSPMKLSFAFSLPDHVDSLVRRNLVYPDFAPQRTLPAGESVLRQAAKGDLLLSYPFESMEPFLQLLREASRDDSVISIKISIYRLASRAKLVEYLCAAAENGKDVTVLIELRARFDEQNNIDWSQRLEEAGCRILYGFDAYKVHSKVCLITRKERSGISYVTQIGTGNYNEKTAAQYTDLSYITANLDIGNDANEFFKNMAIGNLRGNYQHLLVAPYAMKDRLIELIDGEIRKGSQGRIFLKLNSITDLDLIQKLREASRSGVRIEMIVRGICCILPGVAGETENIQVTSIVGRYLEHSRIYLFGSGEDEKMYLSSADFMTRNMDRRVEVGCPVYSRSAREKIHRLIEAQRLDNVKARRMGSDGIYRPVPGSHAPLNSQEVLMEDAQRAVPAETEARISLIERVKRWLHG
ncbi:polyphosphate kinase 1 [Oscillibacter sp. MSJ-2]|uniref:Polyphosphate kinase n=1 Tax=Dysosmobacter acutus TaxID=2841504 RepID=A0ABS6F9H1_9FIRM|nr:polyphosphate kinase 1 [Dysosmobacter acutus]MBU5626943.1 polyphosphate kinase 1 [Dysosmobacter acutus]